MKMLMNKSARLGAVFASSLIAARLFAADPAAPNDTTAAPAINDAAMMKQMMELAKPNENHKLLAQLTGTWTDTVKMWMAPGAPPSVSTGTAERRAVMDGRYYVAHFDGEMKMPGEDGKLKNFRFHGMSIEGYDNVKKKFFSTWVDNMGTGILTSEGTYDPASKSFTYTAEMEMIPGQKTKAREVLKIVDADHHTLEWYEDRGGQENKTMEITYTRKK
ncbi:MAG: DUF1579 domain-containing protein [Chthoniobacterales bacterium]|nr:DUF1579 domain-containing protein [Chthoniobacterales bacterium]